ncbi:WD40 repeat-like protein [Hanseniaspora valbyensis NRRL Y-1626]|uniref:WD40 repeat-like protein n=1 Tax=Hanseniaspora valbyensis NRRL Y-1626 TaxID=766949 RepID=A0A1B7T9W9_9ASCO|nr:WD40 repeat-like protein [Hanseniaspora valbyensis NRRL Y-1626]
MGTVEAYPILSYWHSTKPIYSCQFNHQEKNDNKFLTCGGDNKIKIWRNIKTHFQKAKDRINDIEYITTLKGFSKPVNISKFSKCGKYIAGCGDDGYVIIWEKIPTFVIDNFKKVVDDIKELYRIIKYFPVTSLSSNDQVEVYSLDWSPDSNYLIIGYMNTYIKIIDIHDSQQPYLIAKKNHNDVVQGCSWDPKNEMIITMSADRSICIYKPKFNNQNKLQDIKLVNRIVKGEMNLLGKQESIFAQVDFNFFRKLQFSPDGNLLVLPYGIWKTENNVEVNCVHIFHRANLLRGINKPIATIPNLKKRCLCVSFNPNYYQINNNNTVTSHLFSLPYKMIFAIATDDEIMIYDTDNLKCLMRIKNLHYYTIYDMSWNAKGDKIIICSKDGFLSTIDLKNYKFGDLILEEENNNEDDDAMDIDIEINDCKKNLETEVKQKQPTIINLLTVRKK